MSINILQKDVSIMNTKREKYRVEIRKTYQMQELENKRFLTVKKSTLNSKKIFLLNIFTNQNVKISLFFSFNFPKNIITNLYDKKISYLEHIIIFQSMRP